MTRAPEHRRCAPGYPCGRRPTWVAAWPRRARRWPATSPGWCWRWRPFGEVRLDDERGAAEDAALAFDPIGNVPPGLRPTGPLARLRADSYRGSRRGRGAGLSRAARRG
ncbi:hypothetical protein [Micromonospora aurantiaca (nom. illeg.)]|uniref:hypothetical protein n=1 Tax=Micromonospora aurantiaca (nom. illeg.) TaxID=47850 RepID=UPI0033EF4320